MFCYSKELTEFDGLMTVVLPYWYNHKWTIACNTPIDHEPYFIMYYGSIMEHDKKARISIFKPEYVHCTDDPTPEWILTDEEINEMIGIFNLPCKETDPALDSDNTVWKNMLIDYEFTSESDNPYYKNIVNRELPDYTKLEV